MPLHGSVMAPNMALQRTRRPRIRSGRSLRSLGSPLNARSLGGRKTSRVLSASFLVIWLALGVGCQSTEAGARIKTATAGTILRVVVVDESRQPVPAAEVSVLRVPDGTSQRP